MNNDEKQRNYDLAQRLIAEQDFAAALIAGAVATVLAAIAYGIIVAMWEFAYGFAAAGVGIAIGFFMGFLGRGIRTRFAVAAILYTIAGCLLGNFFRVIVELAQTTAASPVEVLRGHSVLALAERSTAYLSVIDFVYWFVAVFGAVFLARRPLSRSERLAIGTFELKSRAADGGSQ